MAAVCKTIEPAHTKDEREREREREKRQRETETKEKERREKGKEGQGTKFHRPNKQGPEAVPFKSIVGFICFPSMTKAWGGSHPIES
jgi:hypothetical protein